MRHRRGSCLGLLYVLVIGLVGSASAAQTALGASAPAGVLVRSRGGSHAAPLNASNACALPTPIRTLKSSPTDALALVIFMPSGELLRAYLWPSDWSLEEEPLLIQGACSARYATTGARVAVVSSGAAAIRFGNGKRILEARDKFQMTLRKTGLPTQNIGRTDVSFSASRFSRVLAASVTSYFAHVASSTTLCVHGGPTNCSDEDGAVLVDPAPYTTASTTVSAMWRGAGYVSTQQLSAGTAMRRDLYIVRY